ncbi:hypothetical protein O181_131586 [Austropuccinia psidii MF-1]|uniref:Uncharacterized protein n=1 Tax=Austropuccinia psidii MF-1 TaxID=1389203 RepID=A0A9Q3L4D9_9BASI|nr:hypothetical protein [Austropuccinia psidii MF-1]
MVLGKTINCPFKYQHEIKPISKKKERICGPWQDHKLPTTKNSQLGLNAKKSIKGPWQDHKLPTQIINNNQEKVAKGPWQDHKLPTIRIINMDSKLKHNKPMVLDKTINCIFKVFKKIGQGLSKEDKS